MGPSPYILTYLVAVLALIGGSIAQTQSLFLLNYPTELSPGGNYSVSWEVTDIVTPVSLYLSRGDPNKPEVVQEIESLITHTECSWQLKIDAEEGSDYRLGLIQGQQATFSIPLEVKKGDEKGDDEDDDDAAATSSMTKEASHTSHMPTTAPSPTATAEAAKSSETVVIVNPTPTSSWDAPRAEDWTVTDSDRIALGLGIPVAFLVLGTIGYYRALKFFLHRKFTGESKLPMYNTVPGGTPPIVIGSGLKRDSGGNSKAASLWGASSRRGSGGSKAPSLWGASSKRGASNPVPAGNESVEMLTQQPQPPNAPGEQAQAGRQSSQGSIRPSNLRQAWTPV